jgi:methionyl-tRNA formyltransferase
MSAGRTIYLGTSDFAAAVLRRLAASPHRPALVVTPPDRARGRGRKLAPPPVAEAASELGLELAQPDSVNSPEAVDRVRAIEAQVGVVCAFGQLITDPLLSELEMLNVHPSLLPRWRGAAPIERAIMVGDRLTGVTVMRLTEGLDSGPLALAEETPIAPDEDFASLASRLAEIGGELIVRALDRRAAEELAFTEQDDSQATYAEKISPDERRLDPSRSADELARVVRALTPHIGAYLELGPGERLGIRAAAAEPGEAPPGSLTANEGLRLGCAVGVLRLDVVQPPGGRAMPADDYLRGHRPPAAVRGAG